MKLFSLIFISFLISLVSLEAQNDQKIAQARKADQAIRECIQSETSSSDLGSEFSTYDWAKNLQKLIGKVLYDENPKVLIEIADEEESLRALYALRKTCDPIQNLEKELGKLIKIYDARVQEEEKSKIDPGQGFFSSRKVSLRIRDARKMKVQINSIVNRMEGDDSIFRIFR